MDIPNLSTEPVVPVSPTIKYSKYLSLAIVVFAVITGFVLSRFLPMSSNKQDSSLKQSDSSQLSTDSITNKEDLKIGTIYGNQQKSYKDVAVGVLEKGNINGEGTHILNREGGASQRASLTSSAVDLDLF